MAFAVLQGSLEELGYRLDESSSQRVGMLLVSRIYCFLKKLKKATNGKKRQKVKAETWIKMRLLPNEISHQPRDIIAEYNARARELISERIQQAMVDGVRRANSILLY